MQFRLLGPLEIEVDDQPVARPGAAERALLALLLLSPGRAVPATSLIDRLWAESALPVDPVNALQLRVSKLRRALAAVGLDVVRRDGAGYRADVDPSAVDTEQFAARLRAARAAQAAATAAGTALSEAHLQAYDTALDLWRGEPLSDFVAESWATPEIIRLTELRWAAVAERAQLALRLGRHAEVVVDLESALARNPTHETVAGLLMVALYRSGRQAEALEVFTRTRTVLDDELGLEPSTTLRSLHEQVLRQDPSLGGADPAPAPGGTPPPPRLEPVEAVSTLPAVGRPLVGREELQVSLAETLAGSRLVCLVGPGGAGKTTLARDAAIRAREGFSDGAFEVRLAPVRDPARVPLVVADAVGMSIDGATAGEDVCERLLRFLAPRRLLLLVDNCEHVIDAASALVDELLDRCPGLTVLATSREALGVPGEVQVLVGPLAVPPEGSAAGSVADFPAARLFLDRATAVRRDVVRDDEDRAAVGRIVRALDGMPLAMELAAARVSSLSVTEIAERLDHRFALLTTAPRTAEARQRTLRATVDWSHDLLTDAERRVHRRLSVFHGGFTLAAAEAVVADEQTPAAEVLHVVGRLVEQSLLVAEPGRTTRYGMLETLREYAAERLVEAGEETELARRHATWFAGVADAAESALRGSRQAEEVRLLRAEHANVVAALGWLGSPEGDLDRALGMAGSLGMFWHLGRHLEGRETLRGLLARASESGSPAARARALQAASLVERPRACLVHPSPVCASAARESLATFDELGDASRAALSRVLLAVEGVTGADPGTATRLLQEAEDRFTADGDTWGLAVIGFVRMESALKRGDPETGIRTGHATATTFRQLNDPWGLSAVLYHLGWGLRQFGRYADGARVLEEAIDVAGGAGLANTVQWALADLGVAHLDLGDLAAAQDGFDRARRTSEDVGDGAGAALADHGEGLLAQLRGDWVRARERYHAAEAGLAALGTPVAGGLALAGLARCDEAEGDLGQARRGYDEVLRIGREAGEPALVASALEGLGRLAERRGDATGAAELAEEAGAVRARAHRPVPPHESVPASR